MAGTRCRLDEVHNNYFTGNELRGVGWTDKDINKLQAKPWRRKLAHWCRGWEFIITLMFVLWIGTVLVCLAL
jgi:hypothetical protein